MNLDKVANIVNSFKGNEVFGYLENFLLAILVIVMIAIKNRVLNKLTFVDDRYYYGFIAALGFGLYFVISVFNQPYINNQINAYVKKHYLYSSNLEFRKELITDINKYNESKSLYEDCIKYENGDMLGKDSKNFLSNNSDWISQVPRGVKISSYPKKNMEIIQKNYNDLLKYYDSEWVK